MAVTLAAVVSSRAVADSGCHCRSRRGRAPRTPSTQLAVDRSLLLSTMGLVSLTIRHKPGQLRHQSSAKEMLRMPLHNRAPPALTQGGQKVPSKADVVRDTKDIARATVILSLRRTAYVTVTSVVR